MKLSITALLLAFLLAAGPAAALTAQEVIELKKAGVSEETIQKMIEQERQGAASTSSPVTETKDEVVYQAGEDAAARAEENRRHERWKEKKSLDAAGNVIIDLRR